MKPNLDCKYYEGNKPCEFHKLDARSCKGCRDFFPIKKRILIIKLGSLGDVLRTTSILPAIKEKYPYSHITWITKGEAVPLLENNDLVDAILTIEANYLEYLLNQRYDIAISLDMDLLSATINALCRASAKKGFIADKKGRVVPANSEAMEWYRMSLNDCAKKANRKTYFEHIYRICGLNPLYFKPQYALNKEQLEFASRFKADNKLDRFKKIIGVNTGGGTRWLLKRWTLENYIRLIKLIKRDYPDVGLLLYGGRTETEFNKNIIDAAKDLIIDTGCDNSIEEFAGLISLSEVVLTPDSLGMHISIAIGKTTIVLVGPTSPWEIDTFGDGEIVYNKELECLCCYLPSCGKSVNCMNAISPQEVMGLLEKYIRV